MECLYKKIYNIHVYLEPFWFKLVEDRLLRFFRRNCFGDKILKVDIYSTVCSKKAILNDIFLAGGITGLFTE